jgi:hypothetical protein
MGVDIAKTKDQLRMQATRSKDISKEKTEEWLINTLSI